MCEAVAIAEEELEIKVSNRDRGFVNLLIFCFLFTKAKLILFCYMFYSMALAYSLGYVFK